MPCPLKNAHRRNMGAALPRRRHRRCLNNIMGKFAGKINMLCKALAARGQIYLIDRKQVYSEKLNKPVTLIVVSKDMTAEEFNAAYPDKKPKDPEKVSRVKVSLIETFSEVEVIKYLAAALKGGEARGG